MNNIKVVCNHRDSSLCPYKTSSLTPEDCDIYFPRELKENEYKGQFVSCTNTKWEIMDCQLREAYPEEINIEQKDLIGKKTEANAVVGKLRNAISNYLDDQEKTAEMKEAVDAAIEFIRRYHINEDD